MKNEYIVDFNNVSTVGFEPSPVAKALAGLRAHDARYFMNKYNLKFTVVPANKSQKAIDYVNKILKEERDIVIAAKLLETSSLELETTKWGTIK
jgi:hypothetical protein